MSVESRRPEAAAGQRCRPAPIAVGEADLASLRQRLATARWPSRETVDDWSQGVPLDYLKNVCDYWGAMYDWRRVERELNAFEQLQFKSSDGTGIQILHAPSPCAEAVPVILTHGWPGSVVEFLDVVERLRRPWLDGGDPKDAVHVVCPTLPGYGFSEQPTSLGWGIERISDEWAAIMSALGYDQFVAAGGDWGAFVSIQLASRHPTNCVGLYLSMIPTRSRVVGDDNGGARDALEARRHYDEWEAGYAQVQATRPQTLGYALADSPLGQAAWILEKFAAWTDHPAGTPPPISVDRLLDNVMHYVLNSAGASSARLYWESFRKMRVPRVAVPTAATVFPKEVLRPPRRWAEVDFPNLRYWSNAPAGGHFPALEVPDVFVEEIRAGLRSLRGVF